MGSLPLPRPPDWPDAITDTLIRLWRRGVRRVEMLPVLSELWQRPVSIGMVNGKTDRLAKRGMIERRPKTSMNTDISVNEDGAHKLHYDNLKKLPMWVIYNQRTREYPGIFVTRMHFTLPEQEATRYVMIAPTIEDLRERLPRGLACIQRYTEDVPEIVEVWL